MKRIIFTCLLAVCVLGSWAQGTVDYDKAAARGDAEAQYYIGLRYYQGVGGKTQSYAEAVKWFRKSAEQGNARAQLAMGVCYDNGDGVLQSYEEAVKWYRKSAEQGDAQAQYELGRCYYEGNGVEVSHTEALKWFRKADAKNYGFQCEELGQYLKELEAEEAAAGRKSSIGSAAGRQVSSASNTGGHGRGKLLDVAGSQAAKARIEDLMNHVFGCVDLDMDKCTVSSVNNYLVSHFGMNLYDASLSDFLSWTELSKPHGYNVELNGKKLDFASFYCDGKYKVLTYQASELQTKSTYRSHRSYAEELKKELERLGFTFAVETDDDGEFEAESEPKNGVKVSMRCGCCSKMEVRDSWFTEIKFSRGLW